jgi:hypothetical protein
VGKTAAAQELVVNAVLDLALLALNHGSIREVGAILALMSVFCH